ncbi:JmjC domain-containing protein [Pandoraea sputorum]
MGVQMTGKEIVDEIFENAVMRDHFIQQHFWQGTVPSSRLKSVFSWGHLNHALSCSRITNDRLRLSIEHDHVGPNKSVFRPVKDSFGRPTDAISFSALHSQLELGATAVLESINELLPDVRVMTEAVSERCYARVCANAYFSFGHTSGFGVHNDDHDVIVFQIEGRKRWHFWSGAETGSRATVGDRESPPSDPATEEIVLREGDVLYVPKGTWHDVIAIGEPSLHLTISVVRPSIKDYVEWLLAQNRFRTPYQDIRISRSDFENTANAAQALLMTAISAESVAEFVGVYYARFPAVSVRPSLPRLNSASQADAFNTVSFHLIDIEHDIAAGDPERSRIYALGAVHTVSSVGRRLLDLLSRRKAVRGHTLTDELRQHGVSSEQTMQALRDLLEQGLISKA